MTRRVVIALAVAVVVLGGLAVGGTVLVAGGLGLARDPLGAPKSSEMTLPGGVRRSISGSMTLMLGGRRTELPGPVTCFAETGRVSVGSAPGQAVTAVLMLRGDPLAPERVEIVDGGTSYTGAAGLRLDRQGSVLTVTGTVVKNPHADESTGFTLSARCPGL